MLQSHKIKLEMSQARERLAVLAGKDEPNDAEAKEMKDLTGKYQLMETRYQASLTSEIEEDKKAAKDEPGDLDAESREFHEKVTPNVKLADYLTFAAEGKAPEGAAAEMNAALEVGGVRQVDGKAAVEFPLFLLDPGDDGSGKYDFAATTLTLDTIRRGSAWLGRVFLDSASTALGVDHKMVPKGQHSYPVINSGATPVTTAAGTAKAEETLGATSQELEPRSIRSGYQVSTRDLYRLGDMYEAALRSDLRSAMVESMDKEIINGVAGEITGFLTNTSVSKRQIGGGADANIAAENTGAEFVEGVLALIDGRYANDPNELSFVTAPEVYRWLWSQTLAVGTTDTIFGVANWLKNSAGVMCKGSDHLSVLSDANNYYAIFCKGRGKSGSAVHATWANAMIIHDVYGDNKTQGYESFYIVGHHDFAVVRASNFAIRRVNAQ